VGAELGVAVGLLVERSLLSFNAFDEEPRVPFLLLRTINDVVSALATKTRAPILAAAMRMVLRLLGDIVLIFVAFGACCCCFLL
jgi:hypothetical protein